MKRYIKSLLIGAVGLLTASHMYGATVSFTVAAGAVTNMVPTNGPSTITQLIVSSPVNNTTAFSIYDSGYTNLTYTNAAYTNILSYATNYITTWTNYYGATNSVTNLTLVDYTNTVAATTNFFPLRISGTVPTNGTIKYDTVNYYFTTGPVITNTGAGTATVTVTYRQ